MEKARQEYLDVSCKYFSNEISINDLFGEIKKIVSIKAEKIDLPEDERIMLISNHPAASDSLSLPAEHIGGSKGGNSRNFPSFWFPIVRQTLIREAMGKRRFLTLAHDIGWRVAMQEMGHLLINHFENGRCKKIISCMEKEHDCSMAVFPEGGVRDLEEFHTGFFHIAYALDIRYLVVGVFSPLLSLEGENEFRIINIEDMRPLIYPIREFVDAQKHHILRVAQKKN